MIRKSLAPPDSHYVSAAEGWLMLNNPMEARAELEHVSKEHRKHPEFLEAQWHIHAAFHEWEPAINTAELCIQVDPKSAFGWIHRSYSLHELKRTKEAWNRLEPATVLFPKDPIIAYNMACYACQLGQMDISLKWLKKALELGVPQVIKKMALTDPDLVPLLPEIKELGESEKPL